MVEFALCLPLLTLLVFGVVDLGRVYQLQVRLKNAARTGADFAQTDPLSQEPFNPDCVDPNDIQFQVYAEAGTTAYTVTVTPTEPNGCGTGVILSGATAPGNPVIPPGCPIKVDVSSPFTPLTPILGRFIGNPTIHEAVTINTQGVGTVGTCPPT